MHDSAGLRCCESFFLQKFVRSHAHGPQETAISIFSASWKILQCEREKEREREVHKVKKS